MKFAVGLILAAGFAFCACNAPTPDPIVTVQLPAGPFGVVPSNDGCWLFVSSPAGGISVLHRDNGRITLERTVKIKGDPTGIVLTHDGKTLIAAAGSLVLFLDVQKLTSGNGDPTIASISDGETAGSVYVNVTSGDDTLFISDERSESITVVDLEHGRKIIGKIPVGRAPIALTFSKDEKYLFTTSELAPDDWKWPNACKAEGRPSTALVHAEGTIVVVDVQRAKTDPAHSIATHVRAGCSPVRLAMTPSGDRIFVTARNSNAVLSFDTEKLIHDPDHARVGMKQVGIAPVPVISVKGGAFVVVGNSNRFDADQSKPQTLDVLNRDSLAMTGHIPAGSFPREMRVSPDGNTLFLTNFASKSVEIIDLKRAIP